MADEDNPLGEARLIEHLVGSVLSSIVKSQGLAASQLVDLIEEIGFEPRVGDEPRKTRTFDFDFYRSEVDDATQEVVRRKVTASVPLLTLVNLPAIAIQEAKVRMDLRLVAHQESQTPGEGSDALKLYAVPAKKQLVRTASEAFAIDSAGTIKIEVTMSQQEPLGLDKVQSLLDSGNEELTGPPTPIAAPAGSGEGGPSPETLALLATVADQGSAPAKAVTRKAPAKKAAAKKAVAKKAVAKKTATKKSATKKSPARSREIPATAKSQPAKVKRARAKTRKKAAKKKAGK